MKPTVALYVRAADARARLVAGLSESFGIRTVAGLSELLAVLTQRDVALAVVDAVDANADSLAGMIAAIRRDFATLPLLAYCSLQNQPSSAVLDAVRAGASGLIFRGIDDYGFALRSAVHAACRGSVCQRISDRIEPLVPVLARPLFRYAMASFADGPTVSQAAASLGVDRKTLFNWLQPCGSVGPRQLLAWCRLCVGVGLLADRRRTAEQVALDLGFPSGASFRNMLQRYTGESMSRLRSEEGLACILDRFAAALQAPPVDRAFSLSGSSADYPRAQIVGEG